ncbi:MAG: response regulator transcription factor [Firmicutes bacterium]|nr:response regulator transcription factor [Bacillota bacterium]
MQVLIVDSDAQAAELLRGKLREITDESILCLGKASKVLFEVEENGLRPQVCLIDLKPDETEASEPDPEEPDGIALAQRLQELSPGLQVIFTSEYDTFYPAVYEAEHVWLLRKPVESRLLRMAWDRAIQRLDRWESRMFCYRFAKKTYRIPLREILYFEKDRRKVIIRTKGPEEDPCFYGTMDEVMSQLDHHFLRCHNSYIVDLTSVDTWTKTSFSIGRHKIPISRQYAKAAKAAFLGGDAC